MICRGRGAYILLALLLNFFEEPGVVSWLIANGKSLGSRS